MFQLPQAKRVRREDLRSRSSSPATSSPDVEAQEDIRSRLNKAFGHVEDVPTTALLAATTQPAEDPAQENEDEEEDALEFRLFAPTNKPNKPSEDRNETGTTEAVKEPTITKIRLGAEEDPNAPPGFVIPSRPQTYYFRPPTTPSTLLKLQSSALSGPRILSLAQIPWPGTHLPWKLQVWTSPASSSNPTKPPPTHPTTETKRKCRKNKKTRIALRIKTAAARNKRELEAMGEAERAEVDKEKRARRNREKKLKKRGKARETKALAGELGLPVGLLEGRK